MTILGPGLQWALRALPILLGGVLIGAGVAWSPHVGLLFVASFWFAWWFVPHTAIFARRVGAIAIPGGRGIHRRSTPALGGVAIFLPVSAGLAVLGLSGDGKALGLFVGVTLIFGLGVLDDIDGVRPSRKILVQLAAGACLILAGFRLPVLAAPGLFTLDTGVLEIPLILMWIVLATNAFNVIDGMDGIAASVAFLAAIGLVSLGIMPGIGVLVAGTSLGFLLHNLPPARVFLGDCGSQTLGFLLAALVLLAPRQHNVPLVVALLAYPLGDLFLAALRRLLQAKPIFAADRCHVHHKALVHLGSSRRVLIGVVVFSASLMTVGLLQPGRLSLGVTLLAWGSVAAWLLGVASRGRRTMLANRRPLRALYAVRRRVRDELRRARTAADVTSALRNLVEAWGLQGLAVRGIRIDRPGTSEPSAEHVVRLRRGTAAWYTAHVPATGILEEERGSVLTELLRDADSRLQAVERTVAPGVPPLRTRQRPMARPVPTLESEG